MKPARSAAKGGETQVEAGIFGVRTKLAVGEIVVTTRTVMFQEEKKLW